MKLVPYDKQKIQQIGTRYSDVYNTLMEFRESGMDCCKLEGYPHKTATNCAVALRAAIQRYKMFTVRVFVRKDEVFLVKNEELYGKK